MSAETPEQRGERTRDGRNIDPALGTLTGEAAHQRGKPHPAATAPIPAAQAGGGQVAPDYYGQPMLKATIWTWMVPAYFFIGGLSGASSAMGTALRLLGQKEFAPLERKLRIVGAVGDNLSAVLLMADLGRPTRFLNMLRVVRITSPMSIGSWILSMSGAANSVAALLSARRGVLGGIGDGASAVGGVLGIPLAGYTGVLLANTAVPVWQSAHRTLPPAFAAAAIASAAALMQLMPGHTPREARAVRAYGIAGKVLALATGIAMEREVRRHPRVGRPLHTGFSGALWAMARLCTAASLGLSLLPRRRPWLERASGALGLVGGVAFRFAFFLAGKRSARDPQASFQGQRAGLGGAEFTGVMPALGPGSPARTLADARTFKLPVLR
jgi:hypothetical protein